jgi:MarR family 2-MHQ and catechol resistance regulon transcriptional repressor
MGTHFKGKPSEVRALDAFLKLVRATRGIHEKLEHALATHDLTENQLGILEMLLHLGPLCQRAMAEKLLTSGGNVTLLVDGLERRELVKRERNVDDRRFITVHLTTGGRALIERVFPEHAANVVEALSPLTAVEQVELGRLCKKLGVKVATGDEP